MQILYKEKALLANQNKLERAEKSKNWIGRNWINVALFGVFISVVGPYYEHQPDGIYRRKAESAMDVSDHAYVGTAVSFAVFYTLAMLVAYFVWKYQDNKQIKYLKQQREILQEELRILRNQ